MLKDLLDLDAFSNDINDNIFLLSNIPEGYGLGSSGAVVAAIYDKYAIKPEHIHSLPDLNLIRSLLSQMENFFHSKSSGLDPLISLIQQPIHLKEGGEVNIVEEKILIDNYYTVDLFDTNISRHTSTIVGKFNKRMTEKEFKGNIENIYLKLVSDCIRYWVNFKYDELKESLLNLSEFQLKHFDFSIPDIIREKWQKGLNTGKEIYKLCGAGGGGFMIRFLSKN
jgi:mevalonate kinase